MSFPYRCRKLRLAEVKILFHFICNVKIVIMIVRYSREEKLWGIIYIYIYIYVVVVVIAWCRVQYGKYFASFSYFATYFTSLWASEIVAKYEKRGKYLSIWHEATCDNYLIIKCLLKSNVSRVMLLTNCIELALYNLTLTKTETRSKTASTIFLNIWQLYISAFQYEYFLLSSFVSYSIFCCNQFVFECFVPNIRLLLKTRTY